MSSSSSELLHAYRPRNFERVSLRLTTVATSQNTHSAQESASKSTMLDLQVVHTNFDSIASAQLIIIAVNASNSEISLIFKSLLPTSKHIKLTSRHRRQFWSMISRELQLGDGEVNPDVEWSDTNTNNFSRRVSSSSGKCSEISGFVDLNHRD